VFEANYLRIFGMRLPVMDTVHQFLVKLPPEALEKLRETLMRRLMERKVFDKWKYKGYYNLSFDGTGIHTFDQEPFQGCPYKETKNSIKWYVNVLEAKLVFSNGFSLSLGSEWMVNQQGKFDKQDCEHAAFKRLAKKIKDTYPRLAVLVTADGLYCNGPIFDCMQAYGWKFIFTYKDECLKSVWRQLHALCLKRMEIPVGKNTEGQWVYERFGFINELKYKGATLHFVEHLRYLSHAPDAPLERHVHLTNCYLHEQNVRSISQQGRMRWNIENQGFNTQKNQGYQLQHKYARKNFQAMKNYYLLLQLAHLLVQLIEKLQAFQQPLADAGRTMKAIIADAVAELTKRKVGIFALHKAYRNTCQLRY